MLKGSVMTTLNILPNVKPDIVRMDQEWESWDMDKVIENLQNWLRRNKIEGTEKPVERKERHWYTGERARRTNICVYCDKDHWSDKCGEFNTLRKEEITSYVLIVPRQVKVEINVRVESVIVANQNTMVVCVRIKLKDVKGTALTGFTPSMEESLPRMLPVKYKEKFSGQF